MSGRKIAAGAVFLFVVAAGFGWAVGSRRPDTDTPAPSPQNPASPASQDELFAARTKGRRDAPMTVYEIADFQCPACRLFFDETLPALMEEYVETGKLRIIFVNFPLVSIHPNAPAAHEFAMCAAEAGEFWPVHDLLYRNQDAWASLADPSPYFFGLADSAKLSRDDLSACLASGAARATLLNEAQGAFNAGVRSTPSFVIEGGLVSGAAPIDAWRPLLDSIYAAKTGN